MAAAVATQSANPATSGTESWRTSELIERPGQVDRSMGDVHAAGNAHVHLDPRNIARVAAALGERMAQIDSETEHYRMRTRQFLERWRQASAKSRRRFEAVMPVAVGYLLHWLRHAGSRRARIEARHSSDGIASLANCWADSRDNNRRNLSCDPHTAIRDPHSGFRNAR